MPPILLGLEFVAKSLGQHVGSRFDIIDTEGDTVKAAQLVFVGNRALLPWFCLGCIVRGNERKRDAIRIVELNDGLAELFGRSFDIDIVCFQPIEPVFKRIFGDEVRRDLGLSRTELPGAAALSPGEERDVGPWCPLAIAEIEVVGVFVVVIDGLFQKAQTERFDVEFGVSLWVTRDSGHVM